MLQRCYYVVSFATTMTYDLCIKLKQFSYNPLDPLFELFGNFTHGGVGGTIRSIPSVIRGKIVL